MSLSMGGGTAKRPAFALPFSFLIFGLINFLLFNAAFGLGLPSFTVAWMHNPSALLTTHLFTLGFVTSIIMGALYQLVPVILETTLWSTRLGFAHLALYVTGVAILLPAFKAFAALWLVGGGSLVLLSVILFLVNMGMTIKNARRWHHGAYFLLCSLFYLAIVAFLGLVLSFNLEYGFLGSSYRGHLVMHVVVGFGGWFTLTILGVAYRLIPMFTLSHHQPGRYTWAVLTLTNLAIGGLIFNLHGSDSPLIRAGFMAIGLIGILIFFYEMVQVIRKRIRSDLDLSVRFAAVAAFWILTALTLALLLILGPAQWSTPARVVGMLYAMAVGWVAPMIIGHLYKIFPFLLWTEKYAPKVGKEKVPLLREMFDTGLAVRILGILTAGTILVVTGLWGTWLPLAIAGSWLNMVASLLFGWGIATIFRR